MKDTQFIDLLKKFSTLEINHFEKFLISPYFNTNKNLSKMYACIKKFHPNYNDENIAKDKIYSKLFPGENYDDGKMRYYTNELLKLAENFLAQENLKKDRFIYDVHSLKELIERREDKLSYKKLADIRKTLQSVSYPNEIYFFYLHTLSSLSNYLLLLNDEKQVPDDFIKEGESIIMLMFVVITQTSSNLLLLNRTYNQEIPQNLIFQLLEKFNFEEFIRCAEEGNSVHTHLLKMYYAIIMLKSDHLNDAHFYYLKSQLPYYAKVLDKLDLYNVYIAMQSYVAQALLRDKDVFRKERFELSLLAIEFDAYSPSSQKYLLLGPFREFILSAIYLGEFEAAENFISDYSNRLDPKTRNDSVNIAFATIRHAQKKYDEALESLSKVKPIDLFFKHDIKSLSMMIYYDKDLIEATYEMADTYRQFVVKNKNIPAVRRKRVISFINTVKELLMVKSGKSKKTAAEIYNEISNTKNIQYSKWLLEKANELAE